MNDSIRIIDPPEYRTSEVKHYRGNPFIEALPPIMNKYEAAEALEWLPDLPTEEERLLPGHIRIHYIATIRKMAIALPEYIAFEPIFSMMLRTGYLARNPVEKDTWKTIYQNNLQRKITIPLPSPVEASHSALFSGISGTGKTTYINRVLSTIPQVIQHTKYKDSNLRVRQLVWLKVDCPADGTPKSMCKNFLSAVDRVLGTNHAKSSTTSRVTGPDLLLLMQSVAQNNFLGILVLDELHHLRAVKTAGDEELLDALAALFNSIEVPIIGIATPSVTKLFAKKLQNVRRAASNGAYEFRLPSDENDPGWSYFIEKLWQFQWLRKPTKLTPKLKSAFFKHSHGITFFSAAMFILCQYRLVLDEENEVITTQLLDEIAAEELAPLQRALRVLRSGQEDQMRTFDDLLPDDIWKNNLLDPSRATAITMARKKAPKNVSKNEGKKKMTRRQANAEVAKADPLDLRNQIQGASAHESATLSGHIPTNPLIFAKKSQKV